MSVYLFVKANRDYYASSVFDNKFTNVLEEKNVIPQIQCILLLANSLLFIIFQAGLLKCFGKSGQWTSSAHSTDEVLLLLTKCAETSKRSALSLGTTSLACTLRLFEP